MVHAITLVVFTLLAWLFHWGITSIYSKRFRSTKSVIFRLTHSLEIFVTTSLMIFVYQSTINGKASVIAVISIVWGTLIVLDVLCFLVVKRLGEQFDFIHFVFAYSMVALAVLVVMRI